MLFLPSPMTPLHPHPASLVTVCITPYPLTPCTHAHPHTPRHTLACRRAGRPIVLTELSAQCWESLVAYMPVASWCESRKTCCCFRSFWPVCHLFQGNRSLQEISPVENTHRDNDGKRQQSENVWLKWKPRCQVLIMSFLNKLTLKLK